MLTLIERMETNIVQQAVEYVPYSDFITVVIGIVSIILGGFVVLFIRIGNMGERVTKTETQNTSDIKNIDGIWDKLNDMGNKIENVNKQRSDDILKFTNTINNLDKTLGKMEGTLERMDLRFGAHEREIAELRKKQNGG